MKLTWSQANCYAYHPSKEDDTKKGIFNGWGERRKSYYHHPCGDYFSIMGEKHRCEDLILKQDKKMKEWKKYAQKGFASLFSKGYLKK